MEASEKLFKLLKEYAVTDEGLGSIAEQIVEKAFWMGHLYSDMGYSSRVELHRFMSLHYPVLAAKKPPQTRWKKFLFDEIGFVAPACLECKDFSDCHKCDLLEGEQTA